MARFSDDSNEDPQQTMRPHPHEAPRRIVAPREETGSTPARGRRLKLGTPTRASTTSPNQQPAPEVSPTAHRGFKLGGAPVPADSRPPASKTGVQPWILMVAGGALLLLVVAVLLMPSSASNPEAAANEKLVRQYTQYLETKTPKPNIDVNARNREVRERLQAITWARAVGDRNALEGELRGLLFMDNDKNSPLYQYSVGQLKLLPVTKTGL